MSLGRFLWLLIIRPQQAFEEGKGRFLWLSLCLGIMTNGSITYVWWLVPGHHALSGLLWAVLGNIILFLTSTIVLHVSAHIYSVSRARWLELLSVAGFAVAPVILADLVLSAALLSPLNNMYGSHSGLAAMSGDWLIVVGFFRTAMSVAGWVLQYHAVRAIYRPAVKHAFGVLLILALSQLLILSPLSSTLAGQVQIRWQALALMNEQVDQVDVNPMLTSHLQLLAPNLVDGGLVVCQIPGLSVTGENGVAEIPLNSAKIVAEIVATPGETVELRQGDVWVNGELAKSARVPLPTLSMSSRQLQADQYYVYFLSPEALGKGVKPESLIVTRQQVLGAVSWDALTLVQWLMR